MLFPLARPILYAPPVWCNMPLWAPEERAIVHALGSFWHLTVIDSRRTVGVHIAPLGDCAIYSETTVTYLKALRAPQVPCVIT